MRGTEETEELARALNGLAERTNELLAEERLAVADLSHRLRTPVTALRLDAEAVEDPTLERRLREHIGVLQRTIDAIVHEARRPVRTDLRSSSDATAVVRERAATGGRSPRTRAAWTGRCPTGPLPVRGGGRGPGRPGRRTAGQRVRPHPRAGGASRSGCATADGKARPRRGATPGPDPEPARRERTGSTGLGLDIARRTAVGCGGALTFGRAPGGGTRVEVALPVLRG